jgi:hypothetical protein
MSATQRGELSTAPRRAPLSSNYLPWLAPPRIVEAASAHDVQGLSFEKLTKMHNIEQGAS